MTKGIATLKGLIAISKLKDYCTKYDVSYKFCHAVAHERRNPTYEIMKRFIDFIPPSFWYEKADMNFMLELQNNMVEIKERHL